MKKLFLVLLIPLCMNAQTGYLGLSNETMQYDKQQHALGGTALGFVSYLYFETKDNTEIEAYFKSSAVVLSIAVLKESNDKWLGHRAFSLDDIGATMFGHFCGATTAYLIRKSVKNRKRKYKLKQAEKITRIDSFYD